MEKLICNLFEENLIPVSEIAMLKTSGNISYLIKSQNNKYILRLCGAERRFRCKNEVLSEICLLKFLNKSKFPVPKLVSFKGNELISLRNRNGIWYSYVEGEVLNNCKENHCYELGVFLSNLHNTTVNFSIPFERKKWDLDTTKELFSEEVCVKCEGKRLNTTALSVRIFGKNIWEVTSMMIGDARDFFAEVEMDVPELTRKEGDGIFAAEPTVEGLSQAIVQALRAPRVNNENRAHLREYTWESYFNKIASHLENL